jgi:NAD(P)H-quinone oxidoreductase subunit 5
VDAGGLLEPLCRCAALAPGVLLAYLGLAALLGRPLSERAIAWATYATVVAGLAASVATLSAMLAAGLRLVLVDMGHWVVLSEEHFHFHVKFVFDRLSVPFVILSYLLCGVIGAFANAYMHREPGFFRFFLFFAMFLAGMIATSLAGTIEVLFAGWELVGLSSALLVAFFHERPSPVRNGLRVWSAYRIADAAFLAAAVVLHHLTGEGDFSKLMGAGSWPDGSASLTHGQALFVGSLLLVAAAGKSALIPFSGWLPRAMEGPTPSSAVFYGALSVHLGAFLLLRTSAILELSTALSAAAAALGLATAVYAALCGRVQPDVKGSLAFASLTQVGVIVAVIGLAGVVGGPFGRFLRYVALAHIVGHACLRTLQLLRAPSLLHDYHTLENAIGGRLGPVPSIWDRAFPLGFRDWAYRFALHRGFLDAVLSRFVAAPFLAVFQWCDAMERRWTDALSGGPSRPSDRAALLHDLLDEAP